MKLNEWDYLIADIACKIATEAEPRIRLWEFWNDCQVPEVQERERTVRKPDM